MNEPSIFTKIIRGEIPSHKLYEDDDTFVFLDIFPSVKGHTLVIPKKQIDHLWDLEDRDYQALMATVKKAALILRERLQVERVGVKVMGMDVPHAHVHLIPFNNSSEFQQTSDERADDQMLAELAQKLSF